MASNNEFTTLNQVSLRGSLPDQCRQGSWVGRAWLPEAQSPSGVAGPHVITVRDARVIELSDHFETLTDLVCSADPVASLSSASGTDICELDELLDNSLFTHRPDYPERAEKPFLLPPNDLQAIKACGVTFAVSMLERMIEERAQGEPAKAAAIRSLISSSIGTDLSQIEPGSDKAIALKAELMKAGLWSQYLEVGIGPDAEVFSKSQPLAAITTGAQLGILETSRWNNPEPEIALLVSPDARLIGATLGNDVNLRDYEGRSALLLGKAKDQNGTCCLGPLFRLFDDSFSIEDVKSAEVALTLVGEDGFRSSGANKMNQISRAPEDIIKQVCNRSHQYPDGLVLFLGTMFAPTDDRGEPGMGFTHKVGDRVDISSPKLGRLINWVNYCHEIPEWRYGLSEMADFIARRRVASLQSKAS